MTTKRPNVLEGVSDAYPRTGPYVRTSGVTFKPARVSGVAAVGGRETLVHLSLSDIEALLGALPALDMFDRSSDAFLALMNLLKALKEV